MLAPICMVKGQAMEVFYNATPPQRADNPRLARKTKHTEVSAFVHFDRHFDREIRIAVFARISVDWSRGRMNSEIHSR